MRYDILITVVNSLCMICVIILTINTLNKDKYVKKINDMLQKEIKKNVKLTDENITLKLKLYNYENNRIS